ncbi:hypothetical protein L208DRAFT_1488337, partial [Tricholoma matsutake]
CAISLEDVGLLWDELRQLIWGTYTFVAPRLDLVILKYGHDLGLAADMLYPPQHSCVQPGCSRACRGLCLKKTYYRRAVLYTLGHGAVPAYSVSLYCEDCKVSYYHNYYVKGGHRHYYTNQLCIIEAGKN